MTGKPIKLKPRQLTFVEFVADRQYTLHLAPKDPAVYVWLQEAQEEVDPDSHPHIKLTASEVKRLRDWCTSWLECDPQEELW